MQWRDLLRADNACPRIYDSDMRLAFVPRARRNILALAITSRADRRNDSTRRPEARVKTESPKRKTSSPLIKTDHAVYHATPTFFLWYFWSSEHRLFLLRPYRPTCALQWPGCQTRRHRCKPAANILTNAKHTGNIFEISPRY